MQDWRISIDYVPHYDFDEQGTLSQASWHFKKKVARIQMAKSYEVSPEWIGAEDRTPEVDLVHELLHLHLAGCEFTPAEDVLTEQAIHAISNALVELKHG